MNNRKYQIISVLVVLLAMVLLVNDAEAQCAMCKAGVQSNHAAGGTMAEGLNKGILYMLATPYLLVGAVGFIWWKGRQAKKNEGEPI